METMILQTICGAVMVLIGAVIARGWPEGGRARTARCTATGTRPRTPMRATWPR